MPGKVDLFAGLFARINSLGHCRTHPGRRNLGSLDIMYCGGGASGDGRDEMSINKTRRERQVAVAGRAWVLPKITRTRARARVCTRVYARNGVGHACRRPNRSRTVPTTTTTVNWTAVIPCTAYHVRTIGPVAAVTAAAAASAAVAVFRAICSMPDSALPQTFN